MTGRDITGRELHQGGARMLEPAGEIMDSRWAGAMEKHLKVTKSRTQRVLGTVKLFCRIREWWTHVRPLSKPTECTTP